MNIQRYDDQGYGPCQPDPEGPWVRYADHVAEVKRVRGEVISENGDWIFMPTLALDQIKQHTTEAMRAACIAAVEALIPKHSDDAMWEQAIAVLREVKA